jgi:hypothetical protein
MAVYDLGGGTFIHDKDTFPIVLTMDPVAELRALGLEPTAEMIEDYLDGMTDRLIELRDLGYKVKVCGQAMPGWWKWEVST